jgi:glutamate racemase
MIQTKALYPEAEYNWGMKIGVFDSGLGGLLIAHSLIQALPEYDYLYLGDTARVPYGNRSQEAIYEFTRQAVDYLFHHGCGLIIVACNTASAEALRRIQQEYLPKQYPDRKVLGVLVPAVEAAIEATKNYRVGVLATRSTIESKSFNREITKRAPEVSVMTAAAPLLVPLVENSGTQWAGPILEAYLAPLQEKNIDTLILGCTHYPYLKKQIQAIVGPKVHLVSQDEVVPSKLAVYLHRHPEVSRKLSRDGRYEFHVTDLTPGAQELASTLFGQTINLHRVANLATPV